MGDMKASITLGVQAEIENLQQIQKQLQDALQHVNPDTKMFASLNKMLQKTAQALQQLAIDSEKPFSKQSQIDSFENKFLNVSGTLAQIGRELGNIDFSQLKLTEEQQNQFNNLKTQIDETQNSINNFSADKLKEMAKDSQEMANSLQEFGVNINTNTLESAFEKLDSQIIKMTQNLENLKEKRDEAINAAEGTKTKNAVKLENAQAFLKFLDARNKQSQLAAAPAMFTKNGSYLGAGVESNARKNFLRSIGLSEKDIEAIQKAGSNNLDKLRAGLIDKIRKIIQEIQNEQEKADQAVTNAESKVNEQQVQIDRAETSKQEIQGVLTSDDYAKKLAAVEQKYEDLLQKFEAFKQEVLAQSEVAQKGKQANDQLSGSMEGLRGKTESASESLNHLTERAEKLNTIKNAIANWMGFYQVLNLIRNAVRYVIEDIRGLDKVMTEIAVVTNMTQKDLWAQMNTYQAIAREYAVSTQGVYQVSQIYYQQGNLNI